MTPVQLKSDDVGFGVGDLLFFCFTPVQQKRESIKVFFSALPNRLLVPGSTVA